MLGGDLGHKRFPTLPPCRHVPGVPQGGWGLRGWGGGECRPPVWEPRGFGGHGCINPWLRLAARQEEMDPDPITLSRAVQRHDGAARPVACSAPRQAFLGFSLTPVFQGLWSVGFLTLLWDQSPDLIQHWLLVLAWPLKAPWFVWLSVTEPAVTLLPSPSFYSPCTQPLLLSHFFSRPPAPPGLWNAGPTLRGSKGNHKPGWSKMTLVTNWPLPGASQAHGTPREGTGVSLQSEMGEIAILSCKTTCLALLRSGGPCCAAAPLPPGFPKG